MQASSASNHWPSHTKCILIEFSLSEIEKNKIKISALCLLSSVLYERLVSSVYQLTEVRRSGFTSANLTLNNHPNPLGNYDATNPNGEKNW